MRPVILGFRKPGAYTALTFHLPLHPGWLVPGERTSGNELRPLRSVADRFGSFGVSMDRVHVCKRLALFTLLKLCVFPIPLSGW